MVGKEREGRALTRRHQEGRRETAEVGSRTNYQDDKASHPRRVMDNAIVVCWEDLRGCTGPFLYSVIEHAETLLEAELEVTATVDD